LWSSIQLNCQRENMNNNTRIVSWLSIFVFFFGCCCCCFRWDNTIDGVIASNDHNNGWVRRRYQPATATATSTGIPTTETMLSPSLSSPSPESLQLSPRIISFNIMVAGLAGMGKTTFCRALLNAWWQESVMDEQQGGRGRGRTEQNNNNNTNNTTRRRRFLSSSTLSNKNNKNKNKHTQNKKNAPPPPPSSATVSTTDICPSAPFEYYDAQANTILRVTIIDTPGFGNQVNHHHSVQPITEYISQCRQRRFRREQAPSYTTTPTTGAPAAATATTNKNSNAGRASSSSSYLEHDHTNYNSMLVHVCLYFISPGRFLAIDQHFLQHVQQELTIIPIIAKADTMTDEEIARFRAELTTIWHDKVITVYALDADESGVDTSDDDKNDDDDDNNDKYNHNHRSSSNEQKMMRRNTNEGTATATTTANSNDSKNKNTKRRTFYRGRTPGDVLAVIARDGTYPWGQSSSLDPAHSDLLLIRDALLSEHTEHLLSVANQQYSQYRDQQLLSQQRRTRLTYLTVICLVVVQVHKVAWIRLRSVPGVTFIVDYLQAIIPVVLEEHCSLLYYRGCTVSLYVTTLLGTLVKKVTTLVSCILSL